MKPSSWTDLEGLLAEIQQRGFSRVYLEEETPGGWLLRLGASPDDVARFLRSGPYPGHFRLRPIILDELDERPA